MPSPPPYEPLSDDERHACAHFFWKLRLSDPSAYLRAIPNLKAEVGLKLEYMPTLRKFSTVDIDEAFKRLHQIRESGEYTGFNIDAVIGMIKTAERVRRQKEAHGRQLERRAAPPAVRDSYLNRLKNLLD